TVLQGQPAEGRSPAREPQRGLVKEVPVPAGHIKGLARVGKKILVVDDSPTDLQWFRDLLSKKGFEVLTAVSGEEGVSKAKAEMPDLVLMDVVMPGLNGFQAIREIAKNEATKHIPVI